MTADDFTASILKELDGSWMAADLFDLEGDEDEDILVYPKPDLQKAISLTRAATISEVLKVIESMEWWTPHCDHCSNQKLVVKVDDLRAKLAELEAQNG